GGERERQRQKDRENCFKPILLSERCLVLGVKGERKRQGLQLCLFFLPQGWIIPFNIDVRRPQIFRGPQEAQFGYKVLQFTAQGQKWMLVGAPWDGTADDRKGDVYKCIVGERKNSTCTKVNIGDMSLRNISRQIKNMHFGMTLIANKDDGFVACAPLWSQECGTSMYNTGMCTSLDKDFRLMENIAPTVQRCSTYMDIVIVLDGSNSIYPWYEVQNFLSNILSKFFIDPEQIQVGVLQYSEVAVHEWTLRDYKTAEEVIEAAQNISRQEGLETRTASAIHKACTEAFSPERGGREGATKLMIVLTDGESHDGEELEDALEECEKRNVTRYAIAVLGHYIRRKKDPNSFINEIKYIASDPDEKYFFNVTDEAALNDIVDSLGDRIFSLEGTREYNSFELEMSQVGFSTHLLEDGILFGMVGAYDWDGAVLKEGQSGRVIPPREAFAREFPRKLNNHAAYLGYTVSSIRLRSGRRLYLASAPRFQHKGKVILFEMDGKGGVSISQALTGDQIGSYFGSEVCPVDVNGDGVTDVLLVAAPMYLGPQNKEIGRVYLYRVGQSLLTFNGTLFPDPRPQDARFGYVMLAVPDLNHDGFNDVVVGAPLEDNHQGAVYLYHGYRTTVLPRFKQRIESAALRLGLRYFGRSLDGQIDMDGDGLVDLAVGAQDAAVVLRSRRIVQINASISVNPPSINVIQKNCQRNGKESLCMTANFCFNVSSRSLGPRDSHLSNFGAPGQGSDGEEWKFGTRAVFDSSSQKLLQKRTRATVGRTACSTARFHIIDTSDYLRPVTITMKFALSETEPPRPVLDEKLPTTVKKLIPFFKDCGEDDECVTDLVLQAEMDISGSRQKPHVIRKGKRKMVVDVLLENRKENAYNTTLQIWFSRSLHFSSLGLKNPVKMECSVSSAQARVCSVDYPVFRSSVKVSKGRFAGAELNLYSLVAPWGEEGRTRWWKQQPAFSLIESTLNRYEVHPVGTFPTDMSPEFRTTIKIQNLACYAVSNLSLLMAFPATGYQGREFLWVTRILADNVSGFSYAPVPMAQHAFPPLQNCTNAGCQVVTCQLQRLERSSEVTIHLLRAVRNEFFRKVSAAAVPPALCAFMCEKQRRNFLFAHHPWTLLAQLVKLLKLCRVVVFICWTKSATEES
uniref:Integrin subunit alpha 10 n=1 Tax=Pseudonaja textilis TaxID=8673 RepID=A0A670ZEH6_PSETE